MKRSISIFLFLFLFVFAVKAYADYPNFQGYVNDFAHVLSDNFITKLNLTLSLFDQKTTNQIAVVTVNSTQPETIDEYSIHLAEKWKPGQKGKDNGIIMLFAMQDRKMRIEIGRGLEGTLTDIQSKHILTDIIRPEFQQGNYEVGIDKGVNAVISILDPTFIATSSAVPQSTSPSTLSGTDVFIMVLVVIFIIIFVLSFSPFTPLGGAGVWGLPMIWGSGSSHDDEGGGGGFGGGGFSGGGSSSGW